MKLFELFGIVDIKDGNSSKKLDDIDKKSSKLASNMSKLGGKVSSMGDKITSAGGTMTKFVSGPIAAVGLAVGALNSKTAAYGDEIHKASQRMGVSFKSYQEMNYWAGQNGVSITTLEKGVRTLSQQIGAAKNGNDKYNESLEAAGINMDSLLNGTLSTEDAFGQAIVNFSQIADENERSAAATSLFGSKLAGELMPALSDSSLSLEDAKSRAAELGIIMNDEGVSASAAYSDAMDDLKQKLAGVFREISVNLMPVITEKLVPIIEDTVIPAIKSFVDKIIILIEWFSNLSPWAQKFVGFSLVFLAALGPMTVAVGVFVKAIGGILLVGGKLGVTLGGIKLAAGVMASGVTGALATISAPMILVGALIVGLIGFGYLLIKNWDKIKEFAVAMKDGVVQSWNDLKELTGIIFERIGEAMVAPIKKTKEVIRKIIDGIKNMFNFKPKFKDIDAPKVKGKSYTQNNSKKSSTRYFAKGGLMKNPTEFARRGQTSYVGGEAGQEGIVPLEGKHMQPMAKAISEILSAKQSQGDIINNITVSSLIVREEADINRIAEELERLIMKKSRLRGAY